MSCKEKGVNSSIASCSGRSRYTPPLIFIALHSMLTCSTSSDLVDLLGIRNLHSGGFSPKVLSRKGSASIMADTAGPSAGKMRKVVFKLLENNDYNPGITLGQIRNKLEKKLGDKHPGFDFASFAFKIKSRSVIEDVIHAFEEVAYSGNHLAPTKGSTSTAANEIAIKAQKVEEKRSFNSSDNSGNVSKKQRTEELSLKDGRNITGKDTTSGRQQQDPRIQRLAKLAVAMGLMPAIFEGLEDVDDEEKVKMLRHRLKTKGAVFDNLPSIEQIKAAQASNSPQRVSQSIDSNRDKVLGDGATTISSSVNVPSTFCSSAQDSSDSKMKQREH